MYRTFLAQSVGPMSQNRSMLLTILLLSVLAVGVALVVPRRRVLVGSAGCALAVVLGVTLVPVGGWGAFAFEPGGMSAAVHSIVTNLEPHRSALRGWWRNSDGPANVALFVPAGLLLTLLSRRPVLTTFGLTGLSLGIEAYQATLTTRVGSFDDVVANGLGAASGAIVAAVVLVAGWSMRRGQAGVTTVARNVRR